MPCPLDPPRTPEGCLPQLLPALYAYAGCSDFTATLPTFFIGQDVDLEAEAARAEALEGLRSEVAALRREIRGLQRPGNPA